ncbi:hypothetical protein FRB99_002656 [Tulasnella sp. 403]|nr:hypothetical protein FRB99_002656 [Tulasnella sp. 403]
MRPSLAATGPSTSDYFSSNPHNMKIIQLEDRTIHIVRSHEEVEHLKRTKSGGFDWHLHGSPEHVESLKQAHDFHTRRASELRKKHPDTYDEVHRIRDDLDALSRELEKLTSKPVELEANFGKFGYSAHIRTHDADDGPETPNEKVKIDDDGIGKKGAETNTLASASSRKKKSTTMKLYKKPVLRQYFHQGLLYRAKDSEEVASFELFVDLLYVGIIAVNGDKATEDPTGNGFLRFCVTFIPSWKIWSDVGTLISQFATDDILQRIGILFILACLVGYTTNIVSAFETTYSQLIAFYLAARLFVGLSQFLMGCVLPHVRPVMTLNAATVLIPVAFWIGSVHLEEPKKEILIWLAIVWDLFGNVISIFLIRGSMVISKEFNQKMLRVFAYYPAVNIEHKTERTGAFVTLVFGYSIVSVIYQNQARFGLNTFFGKAILSLIQAFCFNWMYFDIDGSYHHLHAIRRHAISSTVWLTAHLPFIMAFTLSGAALSRLSEE